MDVAAALISGAVAVAAGRFLVSWIRYRGARTVECPETRRPVGVELDARRAALTGLAGTSRLQLTSCTRWPERAGCGQECLAQIEAAPQDCLVRNILAKWYAGKRCAICGRPFSEIQWIGQQPALHLADKKTVEWSQVPPERLTETLETASPVCFACHMANTLVREHPELVTDRSSRTSV